LALIPEYASTAIIPDHLLSLTNGSQCHCPFKIYFYISPIGLSNPFTRFPIEAYASSLTVILARAGI
jgi:hypothetical protein